MYENKIATHPPEEFADSIPQLYAPLKDYVLGVVPLMLEHIWQCKKKKGSSSLEELMNSAWLGRLTTLDKRVQEPSRQNEITGWPDVRNRLVTALDGCGDENGIPHMLSCCMDLLTPVLEERFRENYCFPQREFHCWWYTIHEEGRQLALHLVNAYQPLSPFDHLPHFLSTMLGAVEGAVSVYPDIQIVSCGSWLNNIEKFQKLWPDSFRENQNVLNAVGGFGPGAWGQYMTTAGGFHSGKAAVLRQTGRHPFPLTEARSPLDEVLQHLKTNTQAILIRDNE